MSTMDFDFLALELVGCDAKQLKNLLTDVSLWGKRILLIALHFDNMVATLVKMNKAFIGKRRHIRLRHKVVKEME